MNFFKMLNNKIKKIFQSQLINSIISKKIVLIFIVMKN